MADQNATIGSNVTFNVDANGTGLNYQWQKRDANGTWVNIGGATGSSYTINSVQSIHAGIYRVAIINASGGTTYSSNSVLNVAAPQNNAPVITQHPQNANAIAGQNVAFTVAATGNGPLNYQWQRNGVHIPQGKAATLHLLNVRLDDNGSYRCVVSSGDLNSTSQPATLQVRLPNTLEEFGGLMGHWPFTGNGQDASGRNNHATILGGAGFNGEDRLGQANGALQLDGVDDYGRISQIGDF